MNASRFRQHTIVGLTTLAALILPSAAFAQFPPYTPPPDTYYTTDTTISTLFPNGSGTYYVGIDSTGNKSYHPTVNLITGANLGQLVAYNGYVNVRDGFVHDLYAYGMSQVYLSGGSVNEFFGGENDIVNISGGNFGGVLSGNSALNITGGSCVVAAYGNSNVVITGSSPPSSTPGFTPAPLYDSTTGAFTFVGSNLIAANYGPIITYGSNGAPSIVGSHYRVTGTLQDGSLVSDYVDVASSAAGLTLTNVARPGAGISQSNPVLPSTAVIPNGTTTFTFNNAHSGNWFDPTPADSFLFTMTDGSLFTGISGFPTGFTSPFDVTANGVDYGTFTPGKTLSFNGIGVSAFRISGINPTVDASDNSAFPLQLTFNNATASFTMTPAPEPSPAFAVGTGIFGVAALAVRRRRAV